MNLQEARETVRSALGGSSGIRSDPHDLDRAIQMVGDDLALRTNVLVTSGTVATVGTSVAIGVGTTITDFRTERAVRFELQHFTRDPTEPYTRIEQVDYDKIQRIITQGTVAVGTSEPRMIAFRDKDTGFLDRKPGTTWPVLRVTYRQPFTPLTPGSSGTVTLNVPDMYLRQALFYGAAAILAHNDPSVGYETPSWQKYEQYVRNIAGRVGEDTGVVWKDYEQYI